MELLIVLMLAMIVLGIQTICKTYLKIRNSEEAVGNLFVVEDGETYVFAEFNNDPDILKDGDADTMIVKLINRKENEKWKTKSEKNWSREYLIFLRD